MKRYEGRFFGITADSCGGFSVGFFDSIEEAAEAAKVVGFSECVVTFDGISVYDTRAGRTIYSADAVDLMD